MRDRNKGKDVPQEKENAEIQKVLQKIPVSELMNTLVEKMQHSPEEEAREVVQTAIFGQSFSGPIPHPVVLAGYAAAGPDIADRIVKMAESEQRHRQELEEKSVEASIKTEKRGQNYALIVSLSTISCSTAAKRAAAPSASTTPTCSGGCSAPSASTAARPKPNSASSSKP